MKRRVSVHRFGRAVVGVLAVAWLCACGARSPVTGTDAGSDPGDAGPTAPVADAGTGMDGDAGTPATDAGVPDAGYVPDPVLAERPYQLVVPVGASPATPLPLVVLLHGFAETAGFLDNWMDMSDEAQKRTFLLALPEGTRNATGQQFWNATDGCCAAGTDVDDVAYLSAVIADVKAKHRVDGRRVYLVGHSNGGFMAHRFACDRADLVTGIVSFAGSTWEDPAKCTPSRPVSVLQVHGTLDAVVFYVGGQTVLGSEGYPSAEDTVGTWAAKNGCTGTGLERLTGDLDLALDVLFDETKREAFAGCPGDGAAELWSVVGGSHFPLLSSDFAGLAWQWLEAHPRP